MFDFLRDTFDSIPIPMPSDLKSELCLIQCRRKMMCVTNEKHGLRHIVFLTDLS